MDDASDARPRKRMRARHAESDLMSPVSRRKHRTNGARRAWRASTSRANPLHELANANHGVQTHRAQYEEIAMKKCGACAANWHLNEKFMKEQREFMRRLRTTSETPRLAPGAIPLLNPEP
jgi:hypothetical protein